jgi:hypothetical protein
MKVLAALARDIDEDDNRKQKNWQLLLLEIFALFLRKDSPQSIIESYHQVKEHEEARKHKPVVLADEPAKKPVFTLTSLNFLQK